MTLREAKQLDNGVYVIRWKEGGSSLASVGRDHRGVPWFAPCNWVGFEWNENPPGPGQDKSSFVPCQEWRKVASVAAIPVPAGLR